MVAKINRRRIDRFIMNNCKIANELRKYRDLAGCLNQTSLSGAWVRKPSDSADYAEYYISENLTYLDMVTANAAYTLMVNSPPQAEFQADAIAQIMAGNLEWRIVEKRRSELEARLQKLAQTQIYILADHDHQVEQDLYEGPFLPVSCQSSGGRMKFQFLAGKQMPLYQYAEHHRQLIEVPFHRLRDDPEGGPVRHNNNDRMLLLRHFLLQELEILLYENNKVEDRNFRLLKTDREGNEFGLLWILGILGDGEEQVKDPAAVAKKVQISIQQLLDGWQKSGCLGSLQYRMLSPQEGFGVWIGTQGEPNM